MNEGVLIYTTRILFNEEKRPSQTGRLSVYKLSATLAAKALRIRLRIEAVAALAALFLSAGTETEGESEFAARAVGAAPVLLGSTKTCGE